MHVAFVPLTGLRVESPRMRELGARLPDLRRRGEAIAALPSLGLLTLAGMLPNDFECSWHAADRAGDGLVQRIVSRAPTVVAVSATTASACEAYRLGDALRGAGIRCVLGGLHASACPDEAAQHFDAVVVGDGEPVWHTLVADAAAGSLQTLYRAARDPVPAARPRPRFDLLPERPTRWTLQTQRGCPFACEFCAASRLLGPHREKPVDVIRRELAQITALDPTPLIELADDNTFAVRADADELLDVMGESGALWFTETDWRVGERPDVLARLAEAGCVQVLVGLESRVYRHPGMGAKNAESDRILRAVDAVQATGVAVLGCVVVGADGETRESIDALGDFVERSGLAGVQATLQTPFPGTALRRRLAREGRLPADPDWSRHTLFDVTFRPDRMSAEQLQDAFHGLLERIHGPDAARRRSAVRRATWRAHPRLRGGVAETLVT